MKNFHNKLILLMITVSLIIILGSSCDSELLKTIKIYYHSTGATSGYPPVDSNEYTAGQYITVKDNYENLQKSGYQLNGWLNISSENGNSINYFGDQITAGSSDIHLYPRWIEKPKFTVSFDSNLGSIVPPVEVPQGEVCSRPANPSRNSYNFIGWYTDNTLSKVFNFNDTVWSNKTLYAKWATLPLFTVTFNSNSGSTISPIEVTQGDKCLKPNNPTRNSYNFIGWYSDSSLSTVYDFNEIVESNKTLYAKWEALPIYTVTFITNQGSDIPPKQVVHGDNIQPVNTNRDGFRLIGWYKDNDLTIPWNFETDVVTESINLYAKWAFNSTYSITFETNGGNSIPSKNIFEGQLIDQPENPIKTGDSFVGWYQDSSFVLPWNFTTDLVSSSITLYAKWNSNQYTVYFETNGGASIPSISKYSNEYIEGLPIPQKEGSIFAGWYENSNLEGQNINSPYYIEGDSILYAKWIEGTIDPILEFSLKADDTFEVFAPASHSIETLIIPAYYKGKAVTGIRKHGFEGFPFLETVILPETITAIGDYAFSSCTSLSSINTPDTVQYLGMGAFMGCKSLTSFKIPEELTFIANAVFSGCTSLCEIIIPNKVKYIGASAFSSTRLTSLIIPDSVEIIGYNAFNNYPAQSLTSLTLGSGLKEIGNSAFVYSKIETLIIPDSVVSIGDSAFSNNTSLTSLTLGSGLKEIGSNAFAYSKIETLVIPDSVEIIGDMAFFNGYAFSSLTSLTLGTNLKQIGNSAFVYSKIETLIIPDSVVSIGNSAFSNNTSLTSLTLGSGLKEIGDSVFYNSNIETLIIPDSVVSIGNSAFSNNASLTSLTLGSGLKEIGSNAFAYSKIETLVIPDSVVSIGDSAFKNSKIETLVIPDSVEIIGDYAFYNIYSLTSLTLGSGLKKIGNYAFEDTKIATLVIPNSVVSIGARAFYDISFLTSLSLGSGLKEIGNSAFAYSKIETLIIPDSVELIGSEAFYSRTQKIINCQAPSKPFGWADDWFGSSYATINWGTE